MATTVQQVLEEALMLSDDSRVALAERLIESVAPAPQVVAAQMEVVRRRIADLESGRVQPVPGPEGLNRVRETLQKRAAA
ncbi:MAG: addiction module protein [Limisphaerales bacterium]